MPRVQWKRARDLAPGDTIRLRDGAVVVVERVVHVPPFLGHPPLRVTTWWSKAGDGRGQDGAGWCAGQLVRLA